MRQVFRGAGPRAYGQQMVGRVVAAFIVVIGLVWGPVGTAAAAPTGGCGVPLTASERAAIVADATPPAAAPGLPRLRSEVAGLWRIVDVLVAHRDRRGLFALGLAAVERDAVMPMQERGAFDDPAWARALSTRLLERFFDAVRAEFSGEPPAEQWVRHFRLAGTCGVGGERVALTGYNAHITVDLAYALADVGATQRNARDFFTIVDAIAAHGDSIVAETKRAYGVDMGPLFRFYFVGEGLDRLLGAGRATGPMLRAADVGYNVLTFGNGLVLGDPRTRPAAAAEVRALWATGDAAIEAFEASLTF